MTCSTESSEFSAILNSEHLRDLIGEIDPVQYAKTRNYLSGAVTKLSPYFTHGILQLDDVISQLQEKFGNESCAKLHSEFGWREYFQRVWQAKQEDIWTDLKQPQQPVSEEKIPTAILNAETQIKVIDGAISELIETGYMHNHARMWLASIVTNVAQTDWRQPAKWLFYHLLDGDLASNTLSWQWVAGSFSHKKYIANQDNINRFSESTQTDTFLDVSYEELAEIQLPETLKERGELNLTNHYPESDDISLNGEDVILYSIWNLDSTWLKDSISKLVLLIEPSIYDSYPMSPKRWEFIRHWAREIPGLRIFVGEIDDLLGENYQGEIQYREHPLSNHWKGEELPRKWMFEDMEGYYPSFSKFWKTAQSR